MFKLSVAATCGDPVSSKSRALEILQNLLSGKGECTLSDDGSFRITQLLGSEGRREAKGKETERDDVRQLREEISEKDAELDEMERNLKMAIESIKSFHAQQKDLFQEYMSLREKFDAQKEKLNEIIWNYVATGNTESFHDVPPIDEKVKETEDSVGNYHLGKTLGTGQYAVVRAVASISSSATGEEKGEEELTLYAMKKIDKSKIVDLKTLRRLRNEIGVLARLSHPNIVRLYSIVHTKKYIYMLQEKGGPDLFEFFKSQDGDIMEEGLRETIVSQIISGVTHMHRHDFVHRDLKPENVLVCEGNRVKLVDFGLCTHAVDDECTLSDFCGTAGFFAPEMISNTSYNGFLADSWSVGCILLELCMGHEAFVDIWMAAYAPENLEDPHDFLLQISDAIQASKSRLPPSSPQKKKEPSEEKFENSNFVSNECIELLFSLLCLNAASRASLVNAERHTWLKSVSPPFSELSIDTSTAVLSPPAFESYPMSSPSSGNLMKRRSLKFGKSPNGGHKVFTEDIDESPSPIMKRISTHRIKGLPPIASPQTPHMAHAKQIMWEGERILDKLGLRPVSQ